MAAALPAELDYNGGMSHHEPRRGLRDQEPRRELRDLSLAQAFLESAAPGALLGAASDAAIQPLEEALQACCARAQAAWPQVDLPAVAFAQGLGRRAARAAGPGGDPGHGALDWVAALSSLRTDEVYLACACARGGAAALRRFESRYLAQVPGALSRLNQPEPFAAEVQQELREKLFVGAAPKIDEYGGIGELGGWLRVMAVRTALNRLRGREPALPLEGDLAAVIKANELDPERAYIRALYKDEFDTALEEVLGALSEEERELLHLRYAGQLGTAMIAKLFGVDPSTISRRLDRLEGRVFKDTWQLLQARLGLGEESLAGVLDEVQSVLHISLSRVLLRGKPKQH